MNAKATEESTRVASVGLSLSERIVQAREATGLTTAQLARRVGVRTRTLHSWETGQSEPRPNRLVMLAGVLNVTPAWLIGGDELAPAVGHDELSLLRGELRRLKSLHEDTGRIVARMEAHIETLHGKLGQDA